MPDIIRSFIGFELPEKIRSFIANIQEDLKSDGFDARWVKPKNIHLTLKFLGNINKDNAQKVGVAILKSAADYAPISLTAKGIGAFPGINRPRVLWIGIRGQIDVLVQLQKSLDDKLEGIGFPKENRPFKGHLTLARVKRQINQAKLINAIKKYGELDQESFIADNIILFKSDLKPTGAVYTKLSSVLL
ncbi:MAG: RNA 2',3'-cyclic phosphodiesterase [Thermodesulfobacteriota bacterium]|nr:RNA 2',3'-cyclic phosphodiesterase [Thermodesulfobacteriota bacterium]